MVVTCGICQSEFDNDLIFTDHFLLSHLSDKTDDEEKSVLKKDDRNEKYPELFKDVHETSTTENEQKNLAEVETIVANQQIILHKSDTDYLRTILSSGKVISGRTVKIKFLPPPQHVENKIPNSAVTETNNKSDFVVNKFCDSVPNKNKRQKRASSVVKRNCSQIISEKDILNSKYSDIFSNACDICGDIFADSCKLANHIITHIGAMPYYCSLCSFSCISKLRLKQHIIGHFVPDKHNQEIIIKKNCSINTDLLHGCDKCNNYYQNWSELVIHSLEHIINMPFKCQGCQMFFTDYKDFSIHNHIHKNSTVCDLCKIYFKSRIRLLDHVLEHNKSKFFRKFRHIGWNDGLKSLPDTLSVLINKEFNGSLQFSNDVTDHEIEDKFKSHVLESEESVQFENSEDIQHLCEVIFKEIPKDDKIFDDFNDKFNKIKSDSHCTSTASKTFLESMKKYIGKKKEKKIKIRIKSISNSFVKSLNCDKKDGENSDLKLVEGHGGKNNVLNASVAATNINKNNNKLTDSENSSCKKIVFKKNKKRAKLLHSQDKLCSDLVEKKNSMFDEKESLLTKSPKSKEKNTSDLYIESVNGGNPGILLEKVDNNNSCEIPIEKQSHDEKIEKEYKKNLVVVLEKLPVEVHDLKSFRRFKDKLRYKLKQAKIQEKKRKERLRAAKRRIERLRLAVIHPKNNSLSSKNTESNNDVPFNVDSENNYREKIKSSLRSFKVKLDKEKNNSKRNAVASKNEILKLESSDVKKNNSVICSVSTILEEDKEIGLAHAKTEINDDINSVVKDINHFQFILESKNNFVRNEETFLGSIKFKSIKRKCKKKCKPSMKGVTSKKKRMKTVSSQKNCVNNYSTDVLCAVQIPPNLSSNSDNNNKSENLLHESKKCIQYSSSDVASSSTSDVISEMPSLPNNENFINNSVACDNVVKSCKKKTNPTNVIDTNDIKTGLDISKNKVKKLQADVTEKNVNEHQNWIKNQRKIINFDHCYVVNNQNNDTSNNSLKKHSNTLKLQTVRKKIFHKKRVSKNRLKKINSFHKSKSRHKNNIDQKPKIKSLRVLKSIAKCQILRVKLTRLPNYIYEKHLRQKPIMLSNILPIISNVESVSSSENVFRNHNYDFLMDHNYSNYMSSSTKELNHSESDTESTLSSYSYTSNI